MKILLILASLFVGFSANAEYHAEVLSKWFKEGETAGVDKKGNACKVVLYAPLGNKSLILISEKIDELDYPHFNSYLSNKLVKIDETATSLYIELKSNPSNSYTSPIKQTLSATKTSKGLEVLLTEKETIPLGRSRKGNCIIN